MPPNFNFNYGALNRVAPKAEEPKNGRNNPSNDCHYVEVQASRMQNTAWASIYLCAMFNFLASVQYSLFMSSFWPFMETLDRTVSESFFGFVIAAYSLSQIAASPLLGVWSNNIRCFKPPLIFCNFSLFIGNLLYFLVELFPTHWTRYVLLASRIMAGIGLGQTGLLKSYGISSSDAKDRQKATVFITGGNAMGMICGPLLQLIFTSMDFNGVDIGITQKFHIKLTLFTAPPLFACLTNVALILILIFRFRETYVDVLTRENGADHRRVVTVHYQYSRKRLSRVSYDATPSPAYDHLAAAVCYSIRFSQFFALTSTEAISTSFAMMMFAWSSVEVVFNESIVNAIFGVLALATYAAYFVFDLGKKLSGRLACLCALVALLMFYLCTFSWPFLPNNVSITDDQGPFDGGCDPNRLSWCRELKRINMWMYYGLIIGLRGLAFPTLNIKINTLFSRIIGPRLQSKQQCLLEMYGAMGRMLGPLLIGNIYLRSGPRVVWMVMGAELVLMIGIWLLCYSRLVPLKVSDEELRILFPLSEMSAGEGNWKHMIRLDSNHLIYEKLPDI